MEKSRLIAAATGKPREERGLGICALPQLKSDGESACENLSDGDCIELGGSDQTVGHVLSLCANDYALEECAVLFVMSNEKFVITNIFWRESSSERPETNGWFVSVY